MDTDIISSSGVKGRRGVVHDQKAIVNDESTLMVEEQTKRIPNIGFLGLALLSMGASAALSIRYRKADYANFVGLWVPTLLIFGLYNKIVKLEDELVLQHEQQGSNLVTH